MNSDKGVIVRICVDGKIRTRASPENSELDGLRFLLVNGESFSLGHGFFAFTAPQSLDWARVNAGARADEFHSLDVNWILTRILRTGYEIHGDAYVVKLGNGSKFELLSSEESEIVVDTLLNVYQKSTPDEGYAESESEYKLVYVDMLGPGSGVAYFAKKLLSPSNFIGWDKTPAKVYMTPPSTKLAPLVVPFLFSGYELSTHLANDDMTVDEVNRSKSAWLDTHQDVASIFAQTDPDKFVKHIRATGGSAYAEIRPGQNVQCK